MEEKSEPKFDVVKLPSADSKNRLITNDAWILNLRTQESNEVQAASNFTGPVLWEERCDQDYQLQAEYECIGPVHWPSPEDATLYDSENKPVLCKCGKKAVGTVMGKEVFMAYCSEHSPWETYNSSGSFVYRSPDD